MSSLIHSSWKGILTTEFEKPYFASLSKFLTAEYSTKDIYPRKAQVFSVFATDLADVKVVILGQDPYHTPGVADGLAFSVQNGNPPPSLKNIFKEIENDTGKKSICQFSDGALPRLENHTQEERIGAPKSSIWGCGKGKCVPLLAPWAKQGVLLLNTVLTVEAHRAASHQGKGWETFTDRIITTLNETSPHLVFIFWGRHARAKKPLIDTKKHLILESPHPSPFSANSGFFGSRPFSKTNTQLSTWGYHPINW